MISYCWRLFATGFCFFIFGLGGLVVPWIAYPIQLILYPEEELRKKKARKMVHYLFKFFVFLLQASGVSRIYVKDIDKLKSLKGHIIMANHPSLVDVVVLISIVPDADCVVKAKLFRNPFMKGMLSCTGYISNENADGLLDDCKKSLDSGNNLIIFPEGTRTTPGYKLKFQRGAANIALRCKAEITTVLIKVTPTTLTKSEKWYHIPERRFEVSLRLTTKKPILDLVNVETAMSKQSRKLTAVLEQHFTEELKNI